MTRKIEVNEGEMFAVSDKVILVSKYESVLGMVSKLGTKENDRVAYMLTFEGKLNNKERTASVTVALDPGAASDLVGDILHGLEMLVKIQKEGPEKPRNLDHHTHTEADAGRWERNHAEDD